MYLTKTPLLLYKLYYSRDLWSIKSETNDIYLTFDDGPIPEVTPWVLDMLDAYNAKATFFCVGNNVSMHFDIFSEIKKRGHTIGNHTYNHLNGWKSNFNEYLLNVKKCDKYFITPLFRPPYGKISMVQHNFLKKHFRMIYWTVLSGDFDSSISPEVCLENSISSTKKGSIVVFHDSMKAKNNLTYALPAFLDHFQKKGFNFKAIPYEMKETKKQLSLINNVW